MMNRTTAAGHAVLTILLGSAALLGQQKPVAPSSSLALELPVMLRQEVVAGTTPVGARIQAKLAVGTLVNRVVIPQNAVLSGEIIESVAKSATGPSRLAIRMDSARWKNGSAPLKVYLTAWYYPPLRPPPDDDLSSLGSVISPRRRAGTAPDPNNPASPTFPGSDPGKDAGTALSGISPHRALIKNVHSTRNSDGVVTLTSTRFNIKLKKQTVYVLATGDLLPAK
ncbi:MAG: hypothetical protein WCC22_19385 [Terriglobales bacterium]